MDTEPLESIGLTPNEAKTYASLCSSGSITAGKLTKIVGIHRSRMYEALDRLISKGLVHFLNINNVKHYEALAPERLLDLLNEKKESIEAFMPTLKGLAHPAMIQKIHGYQGIGGIKTVLSETLNTKEYVVFGAPKSSLEALGPIFWKNYNQKLKEKKISTRMIFDEQLRKWSEEIKKINRKNSIRYLEKHFDNLTETFVMDDKVIIITWTQQPLGVMLVDKTIAGAYKQFFEMLWRQAKE